MQLGAHESGRTPERPPGTMGHHRQPVAFDRLHSVGRNGSHERLQTASGATKHEILNHLSPTMRIPAHQYAQSGPLSPSSQFVYPSLQVSETPMQPKVPPQNSPAHHSFDDKSNVSSLPCGSIAPDPHYNPTNDPTINLKPFVPPDEITIRVKVDVPDWLQLEAQKSIQPPVLRPQLFRGQSVPNKQAHTPSRRDLRRQASWSSRGDHAYDTRVQGLGFHGNAITPNSPETSHQRYLPPLNVSRSNESGVTLRTSRIQSSSEGDDDALSSSQLAMFPERSAMESRRPLGRRLSLFQYARGTNLDLKRARGCLT